MRSESSNRSSKQVTEARAAAQRAKLNAQAAEDWINFYNQIRPHEGLKDLSPDQFAHQQGLPMSEPIRLMSAPNRVAVVSNAAMAATSVPH